TPSAQPSLAVGPNRIKSIRPGAARSDDERAQASRGVRAPHGILRCEPLVIVVVTGQHHGGVVSVKRLPDAGNGWIVAVRPRAEHRMMPVRKHAALVDIGTQVRAEPDILR